MSVTHHSSSEVVITISTMSPEKMKMPFHPERSIADNAFAEKSDKASTEKSITDKVLAEKSIPDRASTENPMTEKAFVGYSDTETMTYAKEVTFAISGDAYNFIRDFKTDKSQGQWTAPNGFIFVACVDGKGISKDEFIPNTKTFFMRSTTFRERRIVLSKLDFPGAKSLMDRSMELQDALMELSKTLMRAMPPSIFTDLCTFGFGCYNSGGPYVGFFETKVPVPILSNVVFALSPEAFDFIVENGTKSLLGSLYQFWEAKNGFLLTASNNEKGNKIVDQFLIDSHGPRLYMSPKTFRGTRVVVDSLAFDGISGLRKNHLVQLREALQNLAETMRTTTPKAIFNGLNIL